MGKRLQQIFHKENIWKTNKHMNDAQNHYSSGKCKLKSTNPREWLKLKILTKVANLKTSW